MALLEVERLSVNYGAIAALEGVSLEVEAGELVTLIGANGAGKSTTLRAISRLLRPLRGGLRFGGQNLLGLPPDRVVGLGIAHCPEGRQVLSRMNVEDNLRLGAYLRRDKEVAADLERQYQLFPRLRERRRQLGGTLSGGEQQMLAIARALMSRPKLLLLDEPSLGLAPLIVREIFDILAELHRQGVSILLVEQNAQLAMRRSDRTYVLEAGRILLSGRSSELMGDPRVQQAYLGTGAA
jgi:branched-chain amino acid transport system ATP-binding protein